MASKESGEVSSSEASRRSSNAFSSYEDFKKTAGQERPQVSFSLSGALCRSTSVDVSNIGQSNPLDDGSSEEDGEIVESSDASTSMSESSGEHGSEESDGEGDSDSESYSAPSHARASASPNDTNHANTATTSAMLNNQYPDGMMRLHQISDEDQDEQYKYFGLNYDDQIIYCMCCGDRGHQARTCPTRRCSHCGVRDQHASHACPTYRKCTRCLRRGHDASNCTHPQPLIIRNDTCDICDESGHVEEECAKLWHTSLNPPMKDIDRKPEHEMLKVCYNCGESSYDGHWGDDCPDRYYNARTQGPNVVKTWSKEEAAKFMKPGDDTDEENERSDHEGEEKKTGDDEPAPAASRNWQVGLFDD
ncbi:hypothetical protein DOTSEDRAFT_51603 [Dothistroma septosporum NZE10]|uniref:CCHC-type domain-containing protein n=1 Tax=Dothistroma septosporum (strain NZE10 / CBS 128990) TaxID=675120 RepID=N1PRJ7_DOTSN|nr:hypothetical protein DOTSEDRAFT_51603 [Dothistroma septosporum NZE10]